MLIRRFRPTLDVLEDRLVPAGVQPTGMEQEMLELLNHLRQNPAAALWRMVDSTNPAHSQDPDIQSALQFFGVNGPTLASQWAQLTAVAPLAWSAALSNAAAFHNQVMIEQDAQGHQLPGEPGLVSRVESQGYSNWSALAENIYAYSKSVLHAHAGLAIDWGFHPTGIQTPPGHRQNMMSGSYREVGIAITPESNAGTQVGPLVVTQDFGNRSGFGNPYLLGVVFNDLNGDGFYQNGEGLAGVDIQISGTSGNFSTSSWQAGGYQVKVPAGSYTVTFSGGGLTGSIVKQVAVGSANVKVDARNGESGGGGGSGNAAPVLNPALVATFGTQVEDATSVVAKRVSTLIGSSITDVNAADKKGIAIVGTGGSGLWQYSSNGTTWKNLPTLAADQAFLLSDTYRLRFKSAANYSGPAELQFRAWDRTVGTAATVASLLGGVGGSTAYSDSIAGTVLQITPVNDAPVLAPGSPAFTPVAVNSTNPWGNSVAELLGLSVSDVDSGALQGLAVTALAGTSRGTWQYSLDGGQTWVNFGVVSSSKARLLRADDRIRFVPHANTAGTASLTFRAWDQTSGAAGGLANLSSSSAYGRTRAFSTGKQTATLIVA